MLGIPLVQAFLAESGAPPFGIYVHESARSFAPPNQSPISHILWRWWLSDDTNKKLAAKLALAVHEELAREYFDEFDEKISAAPKQS